jgi:8-oxo-dGTP diphosphatase
MAVKHNGVVEAAGGVVVRDAAGAREILAVHRPKYDDWSLPKGKLEPGEDHAAAALREVEEETGWVCRLGAELQEVVYTDRNGRPKRVRYWQMTPERFVGFTPNAEIDQALWLSEAEAATLLSYDADRALLEQVRSVPS